MWAANRLLMKGWSITGGDELLGMSVVNEPASLLHDTIPAPKVLQNQLDHLLERQIFETESSLLKELQRLIRRRDRGQWIVVFLSLVIVLHVLERDTWRLMYWVHHKAEVSRLNFPEACAQLVCGKSKINVVDILSRGRGRMYENRLTPDTRQIFGATLSSQSISSIKVSISVIYS